MALENILDVPCAVQYTDNFNRSGHYSIENDVPVDWKALNPWSQLISVTPQAGLTSQQFHCLVDFIDKTIGIRFAVISDVAPSVE